MNTNLRNAPTHEIGGLTFSTYTSDEIRKISIMEVRSPYAFNLLGHAIATGSSDPRLGPIEFGDKCATCGNSSSMCTGHFGHVELPLPVFNPLFIKITFKLLKGSCFKCCRLLAQPSTSLVLCKQLMALQYGLVTVAKEMEMAEAQFHDESSGKDAAILIKLQCALDDMLAEALKDTDNDNNNGYDHERTPLLGEMMVKSVLDYRNRIVDNYMRALGNLKNKCPVCHKRSTDLKMEQSAKIIICSSKHRTATKKKVKKKTKKTKYILDNEELIEGFSDSEVVGNGEKAVTDDDVSILPESQSVLTPQKAREHLRKVYQNDRTLLELLFGSLVATKPDGDSEHVALDGLFLDVLPVIPSRFRPISLVGGKKFENPHSVCINKVVLDCILIRHLLVAIKFGETKIPLDIQTLIESSPGNDYSEKLQLAWFNMQVRVNCILDSNMSFSKNDTFGGVKQLIEKKDGLIRMHMMGKRVNYAARSVISPDPYISVDEIGVPDIFAKKLTYPQPVTPFNIKELRQAVINGPKVHPGAVMVQNEDGSKVILSNNRIQREAVAKQLLTPSLDNAVMGCKIVYRHLQNGDVLLINRQPTLHKPSIMAHKACILYGEKTFRLNYSNCKTYNADFDGDEMNAHFPQGELARSEAYNITSVVNQYLVPKDGTPLGGLIQDHIISATLLMIRGKFFSREDYQQLVFGALINKSDRIVLLKPAIMYPCQLWSGKQVVSTVLINTIPPGQHLMSLTGKSKISEKSWQNSSLRKSWIAGGTPLLDSNMSESEVIIRNGEILCGILDKAHCGPTPYGLVHCCYELYGGNVSALLLSRLGRLFTHFLQIEGFTLGVHDILVSRKADKKRARSIRKARKIGIEVVRDAFNVDEDVDEDALKDMLADAHLDRSDESMKQLDMCMKFKTDELNNTINRLCMPDGLLRRFPSNNLQLMVVAGAKGTTVNCMQISCMLGQIELEGRRPPLMVSGKRLPSFLPYDMSPRAGGFVDGRFLTGIRPQEYFFHCMAGREGLIDTAVKTSRSGYLQRCLVKHLEGVSVAYDLSVRDSDGSIIQFQYGEDALDISKIPFLREGQLPFLVENAQAVQRNNELDMLNSMRTYHEMYKKNKKVRKWISKRKEQLGSKRHSGFMKYSEINMPALMEDYRDGSWVQRHRLAKKKLVDMWFDLDSEKKQMYEEMSSGMAHCDTVMSSYRPDIVLGSISEKMDNTFETYLSKHADAVRNQSNLSRSGIRTMLHHKFMRSVCEPGEAVGLLAAQSIGEPSTQMTLNTFHFAGRGEMNVTLGIPRLQEILMTASAAIKTPYIEVPFRKDTPKLKKTAEALRRQFTCVYLSEVLEKISVCETIIIEMDKRVRRYTLRFQLMPNECYKQEMCVTPSKIIRFLETVFFKHLLLAIGRRMAVLAQSTLVSSVRMRAVGGAGTGGAGHKDGDGEDDQKGVDTSKGDGQLSSDDEFGGEEEDATTVRNRTRHNQDWEYEEAEAEEENNESDSAYSDSEGESGRTSEADNAMEVRNEADEPNRKRAGTSNVELETLKRKQAVLERQHAIKEYAFDVDNEMWCEVTFEIPLMDQRVDIKTLVLEEVKQAVVHHTVGIQKAVLLDRMDIEGTDTSKFLKTEGVNMLKMFENERVLDIQRLYSNDIHAMADTYGIEAAFKVIVKEVKDVFSVYGIEVDPRHLLLIADYMTFEGVYRPLNRAAMGSSASPLQQMSFETTMKFLMQATIMGLPEQLKSPSSRLVVGQHVYCGTGAFTLLQPITL